jgi:hypothetical protein
MSHLQRACAVVAAWQLGGCAQILGIEELTEGARDASVEAPAVYTVRGTAVGLLEPVTVRLEHPGGVELLRVEEDGTFAFAAELAGGALYSVTFVGEPPCVLADANGAADGSTIPLVSLACESVLLDALSLSGATAPALDFAPARRTYQAEVSLLQQFVHVTATATSPDASISVDGVPIASGVPSEPIALALGDNSIQIAVANKRGAERIYSVSVARAAEMAQYAYGKPSSNGPGKNFGLSVALWGDTLVIGAPNESSGAVGVNGEQNDTSAPQSGAVYVFRRTGQSWEQEAYIKASNTGARDEFGREVALWKDTLAISAPREDSSATGVNGEQGDDSADRAGAVYVLRRTGTSWVQEAYLKASNTEAGDSFGSGLALSENRLAVGAPSEASSATGVNGNEADNNSPGSGAAYLFHRVGATWTQEAYIKSSNTEADDGFGAELALWAELLAVTAMSEDSSAIGIDGDQNDNTALSSGAAYVFRYSNGNWAQEAYLKASNTRPGVYFGGSVSLWEDTLAVGSIFEASSATGVDGDQTSQDCVSSGAVYVFRHKGTDWAQEAYIKASNTDIGDWFGISVSLSKDMLAVGARLEDSNAASVNGNQFDNSLVGSGAAYLFRRTGTSWTQAAYLKASNPGGEYSGEIFGGDAFGNAVALWEDTLAVAAYQEDSSATGLNGSQEDNSAQNSGAVYIFH